MRPLVRQGTRTCRGRGSEGDGTTEGMKLSACRVRRQGGHMVQRSNRAGGAQQARRCGSRPPRRRRYSRTGGAAPTSPIASPDGSTTLTSSRAASSTRSCTARPSQTPSPARKSWACVTPCSAAARAGELPSVRARLHGGGDARARQLRWGRQQRLDACMHTHACTARSCLRTCPSSPARPASLPT